MYNNTLPTYYIFYPKEIDFEIVCDRTLIIVLQDIVPKTVKTTKNHIHERHLNNYDYALVCIDVSYIW